MMSDCQRAIAIVRDLHAANTLDLATKKLDVTMAFIRLFEHWIGFDRKKFYDDCMKGVFT